MSASHLSRATAIFVVDCCQFGPSWIFGLEMELMACAGLVACTMEKIFTIPDLTCYYEWYETLWNCMHQTSAVPQPFLLLIAANLVQAVCLVWISILLPVPTWLAVQWSKGEFFLSLYYSINDMKYFWTVCITSRLRDIHFCCWLLPIWP